jgi:hypothetical protein
MNKLIVAALLALSVTSANAGALRGVCSTISPTAKDGPSGGIHVTRTRPDDKAPVMRMLPDNVIVGALDLHMNKGKLWLWIGTIDDPDMGWARQDALKECAGLNSGPPNR